MSTNKAQRAKGKRVLHVWFDPPALARLHELSESNEVSMTEWVAYLVLTAKAVDKFTIRHYLLNANRKKPL